VSYHTLELRGLVKEGFMSRKIMLFAGVVLIAVMVTSGTALAAKGGKRPPPAGTGTCYVTPNPASVGGQYTVVGSGFTGGHAFDVFVDDGVSTQILFATSDSSGRFSTGDYAYRAGTANVRVVDMWDRHQRVLATCTFQVN
jgi:hypothetical protein